MLHAIDTFFFIEQNDINREKAISWWKVAALQGHPLAQRFLADECMVLAFKYLIRAIEASISTPLLNLMETKLMLQMYEMIAVRYGLEFLDPFEENISST